MFNITISGDKSSENRGNKSISRELVDLEGHTDEIAIDL
jgi:hypothetical protein